MNPNGSTPTSAGVTVSIVETTRIVEYTGGRDVFMELLKINPGVFIFKFGADWCNPCKKIKKFIDKVSLVRVFEAKEDGVGHSGNACI